MLLCPHNAFFSGQNSWYINESQQYKLTSGALLKEPLFERKPGGISHCQAKRLSSLPSAPLRLLQIYLTSWPADTDRSAPVAYSSRLEPEKSVSEGEARACAPAWVHLTLFTQKTKGHFHKHFALLFLKRCKDKFVAACLIFEWKWIMPLSQRWAGEGCGWMRSEWSTAWLPAFKNDWLSWHWLRGATPFYFSPSLCKAIFQIRRAMEEDNRETRQDTLQIKSLSDNSQGDWWVPL